MKHPYRIHEIAARAGLSPTTVDRVLHQRGGVRDSTARQVHQAIADLDRERAPDAGASPFLVDVVVRASPGFAGAVRAAFEAELPHLRPAVIRPRFRAPSTAAEVPAVLAKVGRSRAQGLILTAPETPEITEAVGRLGVPVVTLGTDLPAGKRVAYVGVDPTEAGATGAYLVERLLADRAADVLVVRGDGEGGSDGYEGGFRAELAAEAPNRRLLEVSGEDAAGVYGRTRAVLAHNPSIRAVYSLTVGSGGNTAVVEAFAAEHRNYDVFIAHGLDAGNAALLRAHRLSAVLHHDLRVDVRHACRAALQAQGGLPGPVRSHSSAIQVITPFNMPPVES